MVRTTEHLSSASDGAQETDAAVPDAPATTRNKPLGLLMVITGVIGWVASGILALEKLEALRDPNHITSCDINPWISCGEVMKTWQSSLFGFPNMFIGVAAFAVIITTGMALLSGAVFARWYWIGMQVGVTLGMAFVGWLWYQALYVIGILCPYCMAVWAMMIPLFVWVTVRNITSGVIKLPERITRLIGETGWMLVALLYVAVIATLFFRFLPVFIGTSGH